MRYAMLIAYVNPEGDMDTKVMFTPEGKEAPPAYETLPEALADKWEPFQMTGKIMMLKRPWAGSTSSSGISGAWDDYGGG